MHFTQDMKNLYVRNYFLEVKGINKIFEIKSKFFRKIFEKVFYASFHEKTYLNTFF